MKYEKILLKLSGEALKNNSQNICDFDYVLDICSKIVNMSKKGYKIGIVVGGGNIWRGRDNTYIDSTMSDQIGIMSTTMNSIILGAAFNELGVKSRVLNSLAIDTIVEKTSEESIRASLESDEIIIFGGGTGCVGCSTDTAAALRAKEMNADVIIKLTNVDGVYDLDPDKYESAKMYKEISYNEAIEKNLKVMDLDSFLMCKQNNIPIIITNINNLGEIEKVIEGSVGSIVKAC